MDIKCGYLDFRNPAKETWYTIRAWPRKWIEARINRTSDGQSVLLEAYEDQNEFDKTVICLLLENVTTIRRTPIKNRYAFEIYSGDRPIVFLSADSESLCHEWIAVLKRALFPSMTPIKKLPDVGTEFYHVWALPRESADKIRLIGEFLLAVTEDYFTLFNETGTLCLRWQMNHIKRFVILNNKDIAPADCGKILYIQTGSQCPDGAGQFFFYSIQAQDILQQIMTKIGQAMEKINAEQDQKNREKESKLKTKDTKDNNTDDNISENSSGVSSSSDISEKATVVTTATSAGDVKEKITAWETRQQPKSDQREPTTTAKNKTTSPVEPRIDDDITNVNVRMPPDGIDKSDDKNDQSPPGNNQVENSEPVTVSESSQTGTWHFPGQNRLRGNSTGSSGYSSDPLEISGHCGKYQHRLYEDSTSNMSFERQDSFLQSLSCESDSSFSLSSIPARMTKPRRNTYSGGEVDNADYLKKSINDPKRQILRRCTLSSINELYKFCDDRFDHRENLTDKEYDPVFSRDSFGESDVVFENDTNETYSDRSCAIDKESSSKDIPAPFELLDIYLVSARAKLIKDSQKSTDNIHEQVAAIDDVDGHVSSPDEPPAIPKRSTSLPFNRAFILSPTQTETKSTKKKEKKMERRPSVLASFAKKLISSTSSKKSKEKDANRRSQYLQSRSLPATPSSSPTTKPKLNKHGSSSKYKLNIRWSKSQKQQRKNSKSLDNTEGLFVNQNRPLSFHGSRSIHKISQQNMEVLTKYCSTSFINNSPIRSEEDSSVYKIPLGQSVMGESTRPQRRFVRQSSVQSMDDIDNVPPYSMSRTWKSLELLNDRPMGAQFYPTFERRDRVNSIDLDNDFDSTLSNFSDEEFRYMKRHASTTSVHSESEITETNIRSECDQDVIHGYIDMYQNTEESEVVHSKLIETDDIYLPMNYAS